MAHKILGTRSLILWEGLRSACEECGLAWAREHWFSPMHRKLKLGGIVVELRKSPAA